MDIEELIVALITMFEMDLCNKTKQIGHDIYLELPTKKSIKIKVEAI